MKLNKIEKNKLKTEKYPWLLRDCAFYLALVKRCELFYTISD